MKQRIIVAVIGIPLLLAILCVAPDWATAALLAALSVVGTHELLAAVCGPEKTRRWTALPAVMGILVVLHFYGAGHGWQLPLGIVDGLLLVGVIALPAVGVLTYGKPHALTLLDVLDYMEEVPIVTAYKLTDDSTTTRFPMGKTLDDAQPVVETVPGWHCDITGVRKFEDLPVDAQNYVKRLEELVGCKIKYISVAHLFAEAISHIYMETSVSPLFL